MTKVKTQQGNVYTEQQGRLGNIVIEKDHTEDREEMVRKVSQPKPGCRWWQEGTRNM
jgi:hypothetical protein